MDFNEPLPPATGYIVYHVLMEYIDTFVYEYCHRKQGREFPSLKNTTDAFLTLMRDIKEVNLDAILDKSLSTEEVIDIISSELSKLSGKTDLVNLESLDLLKANNKKEQSEIKNVIEKPIKFTKADIKLFGSCGIKIE